MIVIYKRNPLFIFLNALLTFPKGRYLQWKTDNTYEILNGNQRSEDSPDP